MTALSFIAAAVLAFAAQAFGYPAHLQAAAGLLGIAAVLAAGGAP